MLHDDNALWERCVEAFEQRSGLRLPPVAPTRDQVVYFRDQLAVAPDQMEDLQRTFRGLAIGQARMLGNLRTGQEPNWADPLESHVVYGTVIAKYSDVREVVHPATGEVTVLGSRAKHPAMARIQRFASAFDEDGKQGQVPDGLNMVAMHTRTTSGRVTLGTAVALGGEAWAAMELIESLHEIAGDGIHSLVYDRAITGWHVDSLMANQRIQVIGKAVGATSEQPASERITDSDLRDAVARRAAEYDVASSTDTLHLLRRDLLADMLRYHERLPLGLCLYPTSNRNFDLVRGWTRELNPVVHQGTDGECVHRIAVDDGGLFEVEEHPDNDDQLRKVRVLRCASSTPFKSDDDRWGTRNRYPIACIHGDTEYLHTWTPVGVRHKPDSNPKNRAPKDPVGWRLRPLSRADDIAAWYNAPQGTTDHFETPRPFSDIYSRRNDSESFNEWYQQSLPHHGRAASLLMAAQEIDFLAGALLNNCITWANRRRTLSGVDTGTRESATTPR
ncbi:hypothetical protein [Nocardioides xinjiangensis]|uniref:hypothetical protein n=1 Tax=Nocardioides xinjiangensis TaxID=2817376 RepID=UPI001B30746F|nr:hypothetical protein [Nocardioides sp. SYSU D00778]